MYRSVALGPNGRRGKEVAKLASLDPTQNIQPQPLSPIGSPAYEKELEGFKKEILPTLNRRIITPFYIPLISLICGFLLIKRNKATFQKVNVFLFNLIILIFTEITVRYTGLNNLLMMIYILLPFILSLIIYFFLIFNFSKESKST